MTLEEFINQYRMSDGKRYCKLEEGLQSRYTRQVYESYIDYVYECGGEISEENLRTLKQVYGISNYIKETPLRIEKQREEKKHRKDVKNALENVRSELATYRQKDFNDRYDYIKNTDKEEIVEVDENVMDLIYATDLASFCNFYNKLNNKNKIAVNKLIAHYDLPLPLKRVNYNGQIKSLPTVVLAHARALLLEKWQDELEDDSKYQELKKKERELSEENDRIVNQRSKAEEWLLYIGIGIGMLLFIGVIAIIADITGPFFSMVFKIFADGTLLGGVFGIFAIIITLAFIITAIKNIGGK